MYRTRITTVLIAIIFVFTARISYGADGGTEADGGVSEELDECSEEGVGNDGYQSSNDWDADGIVDSADSCPFNADTVPSEDRDMDLISDACDNCPLEANSDQMDTDKDGIGDLCDNDMDGDLLLGNLDNCPSVFNPLVNGVQPDMDKDGQGDVCDDDIDGDGVLNLVDTCPFGAGMTLDGGVNGEGDAGLDSGALQPELSDDECMGDSDADGVNDFILIGAAVQPLDNCSFAPNPEQIDTDQDGIGDECDPDVDGDGVMDSSDNCILYPNSAQEDGDRDLIGDACDESFCYVVLGDIENCLDPTAGLTVYSPSALDISTGDEVRLRLFANRVNASLNYRWSISKGSTASLKNPDGQVSCSTAYEYHYMQNEEPIFSPTEAGTYVVVLEVNMIGEDSVTSSVNPVAEPFNVVFEVSGEDIGSDSTCTCSSVGARGLEFSALLFFSVLFFGVFQLRRRRRRS